VTDAPGLAAGPEEAERAGRDAYELVTELYPICRSITGDGVRRTLDLVGKRVALERHEVATGTPVFDWTVPREWNVTDAWVAGPDGRRVIDLARSSLHLVSYSTPVRARMTLEELKPHLHTLPEYPDWVPYRTSYYRETWGFCLSQRDYLALADGEYEVCVDTSLTDGHLSYGELVLPGQTTEEVLISCHTCHPSLANDNLSGIAVAVALARRLQAVPRRYTYRFVFAPGTIGAITWLARNQHRTASIRHGLVLACLGDAGGFTYKRSRRGDAEIDRAVAHVLGHTGGRLIDFVPYGYDERQYCSPGFNLPVGSFSRTPHGEFPEYHTSADDLELVSPSSLAGSFATLLEVLAVLEGDRRYRNTNPHCEPQLGKRGLYRMTGGHKDTRTAELAMLWVLNLSDGDHGLLEVAERSGMPFAAVATAASALEACGLLEELPAGPGPGGAA
jgi:aminopeptidase-like protein